jgi:surface protein
MFSGAVSFNQNISNWNVLNVQNMTEMFQGASLFNQNLSLWNVSNVSRMTEIFKDATSFDQDVDSWDTWDPNSYRKPLKMTIRESDIIVVIGLVKSIIARTT